MSNILSFAVLGGDMRQTWLVRFLQENGYDVSTFSVPQIPDSGAALSECLSGRRQIILPLPSFRQGLLNTSSPALTLTVEQLLACLPCPVQLFGARLGAAAQILEAAGHSVVDYSAMEQFAVANAVPTAEGAIQLAMEQLPITLHRSHCLIIGFGRIGKVLANRLHALGAYVTVSARKPSDLAMIDALGYQSEQTGLYCAGLAQYDLIVNTVPSAVLSSEQLAQTSPQCLLLELASTPPGGFDFEVCRSLNRTAVLGAQLPGKVAPATAGAIIAQSVLAYLQSN